MRADNGWQSLVLRIILTAAVLAAAAGCAPSAKISASPPTLALARLTARASSTPTTPLPTTTPTPAAPIQTPTLTPTQPTATPTFTLTPILPSEHYITPIHGHRQYFPLGCETAAAKDWANYFKKDFMEYEFQYKIPISDNPDFGFVGSVNSAWGQVPPYAYGVYAGPIADLLNTYGIQAKAYKGYTIEQVKAKIANDIPVITWVIGNVVGGIPAEYTDKLGNTVVVAAYEHVVIVTGYNETHIRYMNNGKFYDTPAKVFLNSWGVLGNMVIVDK